MEWLKRNLVTVAGILFATATFISDLSGALPGSVGTHASEGVLIAIAVSRALVHAVQATATPPAQVEDASEPVA